MVLESLIFEDHLNFYENLYGQHEEVKNEVIKEAWYAHALAVNNPLRDLGFEAIKVADRLCSNDAKYFLKYGAGRRLLAIWYSYRSITNIAYAKRTKPLNEDEGQEINKDINLIYMHLRGVLDNYAWAYCFEKEQNLTKLNKSHVGLFSSRLQKKSTNSSFWSKLAMYQEWSEQLSDKRDPVAHRIPLYVVPSYITQEESETYLELENKKNQAIQSLDFERDVDLSLDQRSLGTFRPVFAHNPYEEPIPIYPTIPNDMATLICIQKIVFEELQ